MQPGRNDLCPCDSGQKYKQCCEHVDRQASPHLRIIPNERDAGFEPNVRPKNRTTWDVDLSPCSIAIESDPTARPALFALAANDLIFFNDLVVHPPSSAEGVAQLMTDAIRRQIDAGAAPPTRIRVRHQAVADRMPSAVTVAARDVPVTALPGLTQLDEFLDGLRVRMTGVTGPTGAISNPATWAAWDLPEALLTELLSASAAFYAAAPWTILRDSDAVHMALPSGRAWTFSVMGNGGISYGVGMYEDANDLAEISVPGSQSRVAFAQQRGVLISLNFDDRNQIPAPMRRELARRKALMMDQRAHPWIWTRNTISGGLPPDYERDLIDALNAIRAYAALSGARTSNDWRAISPRNAQTAPSRHVCATTSDPFRCSSTSATGSWACRSPR